MDRTAAITEKSQQCTKVLDNDIIKQTKAYKDGHIVYLDAANWYLAFGGLESMEIIAQELDRAVKNNTKNDLKGQSRIALLYVN